MPMSAIAAVAAFAVTPPTSIERLSIVLRSGVLIALLTLASTAEAAPAGWSTYTDAKRGFAIDYPANWTVNPAFVDHGYRFYQGDRDDVRDGVAFSPGGDLAPGTVLQSDQLVLAVEAARPADACRAGAFLMMPSPDNVTHTIVDKPEAVQTVADAGDLYTIEHVAIIASKAPCIAVHFIIVAAKQGTAYNRQALFGMLNGIAQTLRPAK